MKSYPTRTYQIINNYWKRLSGIALSASVSVICLSLRLRKITPTSASIILDIPRKPNSIIILLFTCNYLSFILCTNYSLLFFVRKQKTGFASFTNYYSQARRHNCRIPRIICGCDVIIANTKNYL